MKSHIINLAKNNYTKLSKLNDAAGNVCLNFTRLLFKY